MQNKKKKTWFYAAKYLIAKYDAYVNRNLDFNPKKLKKSLPHKLYFLLCFEQSFFNFPICFRLKIFKKLFISEFSIVDSVEM